ncbi:MAG TPA: response regulator [Elusimicrobiota bacterium]|nr:response regulator [Elusimicrobiota bacterium]
MPDKRIVVIADDDKEALDLLKVMVEHEGHEVHTAVNGREAIDLVNNIQPDMVILDMMMPELDGATVCDHIKNNDILKRIIVILYSAKEKFKGGEIARKVKSDLFLPKPFDAYTLWSEMRKLFEEQNKKAKQILKNI